MSWLPYLILAVLGAPLTLLLHEFSHCVATWATGGKVTLFRPWPHKYDGRFYFGRMMREGGNDYQVALAPTLKGSMMMCIYGVVGMLTGFPLWVLSAWELIDIAWWWRGWLFAPHTDGGKARAILRSQR